MTNAEEALALENRYWRAIAEGDVKQLADLTSDPCVVAGASGVGCIDQASFNAMMQGADWQLKSFAISEPVTQALPDGHVIAYKVHEDLIMQGKPLTLDAADVSVWVRQGDRLRCVVHTESILGDPFGRDRD